jgi:hypothetical protein
VETILYQRVRGRVQQPAPVPVPGLLRSDAQLVQLAIGAGPAVGVGGRPGGDEPDHRARRDLLDGDQDPVPAGRRVGDRLPPAVPPYRLGFISGQLGQQRVRDDPGVAAPPARHLHPG